MGEYRYWISLAVLIVGMAFNGGAAGMVIPLISLRFESWGAEPFMMGLAAAAPAVATIMLFPLFTRVKTRHPLFFMVVGGMIYLIILPIMHMFEGVLIWVVLRFLLFCAIIPIWLFVENAISQRARPGLRGRTLAVYSASFYLGLSSGSIVIVWTGSAGYAPFVAAGGMMICALACFVSVHSFIPPLSLRGKAAPWVVLSRRESRVIRIGAIGSGLVESLCFSLLVIYGIHMGLSEAEALPLLTALVIGGVLLQPLTGWLADRASADRGSIVRLLVFTSFCVCLATVFLGAGFDSSWLRLVCAFVLGGCCNAFYTLSIVDMSHRFTGDEALEMNAGILFGYSSSSFLGPILAGGAMTWLPSSIRDQGFVLVLFLIGLTIAALALTSGRAAWSGRRS